ncbi:hypothetical protein WKH56_32970 [Priestia sp. SB1]|uniref:hypothetical protein n=1 Tax=Priestia sp. SB1 TaxID=3132359 RepID=UPI0031740824
MFLTIEDAKALTTFEEIAGLSDEEVQRYIDRADGWIRRTTGRYDLMDTIDEYIQEDLRLATIMLVEYIWYWDQEEPKEQAISRDDTVKIGSYTYDKMRADSRGRTGNLELDMILDSLKYNPAAFLFRTTRRGRI